MDGTLYYQRPIQLHMGLLLLKNVLCSKNGLQQLFIILNYRKYREKNNYCSDEQQLLHISSTMHIPPADIKNTVQTWIHTKPLTHLPKYKDSCLTSRIPLLQKSGIQVAVYSDYPALNKCQALSLPTLPCYYSLQADIATMKPDPKGIKIIMNDFGITNPADVLMIGDRESKDGKAAQLAGVHKLILKKHKCCRFFQYYLLRDFFSISLPPNTASR